LSIVIFVCVAVYYDNGQTATGDQSYGRGEFINDYYCQSVTWLCVI